MHGGNRSFFLEMTMGLHYSILILSSFLNAIGGPGSSLQVKLIQSTQSSRVNTFLRMKLSCSGAKIFRFKVTWHSRIYL